MVNQDDFASKGLQKKNKNNVIKHCNPPPVGRLRWHTDASRLKPGNLLLLKMCSEITLGRLMYSNGN